MWDAQEFHSTSSLAVQDHLVVVMLAVAHMITKARKTFQNVCLISVHYIALLKYFYFNHLLKNWWKCWVTLNQF